MFTLWNNLLSSALPECAGTRARSRACCGRGEAVKRKAIADAQEIVAVWNVRHAGASFGCSDPGQHLLAARARRAGKPVRSTCATLDRHPSAAISSLISSVSCRRCSPNAPFARLEMADGGAAVNWLAKNLRAPPQRLHTCSVGRTEGPARLPQPFSYSTTARSDRRGRDQRLPRVIGGPGGCLGFTRSPRRRERGATVARLCPARSPS